MASRSPGTVRACAPESTSARPAGSPTTTSGVDVNVAARVAESASGGELLVSGAALDELEPGCASPSRKKLMFRAKGVPSDISVYSLKARR